MDAAVTGQRREIIEVATGSLVVAALAAFLITSYTSSGSRELDGYDVLARYRSGVDGVSIGTDVRAAGIPVGKVADLYLDEDGRGVLVLHLVDWLELDTETSASIETDSLFGQKFVELEVGGGDDLIKPGGEIIYTESSMILDDLLDLIIQRARGRQREDAGR